MVADLNPVAERKHLENCNRKDMEGELRGDTKGV
jgi:hypothetical protein